MAGEYASGGTQGGYPAGGDGGLGQQAAFGSGAQEEKKHHGLFHHGDKKQEQDPSQQFDKDRKHEHYAEGATAAAAGVGLYERHEKHQDGKKVAEGDFGGEDTKKHHHLF